MSNNKRWLIVIGYTMLIFISLPWIRQLWDFVGPKKGSILLVLSYIAALCFIYVRFRNIFVVSAFVIGSIIVFKTVKLPVERIHFIEYGILGWLAYWAGGNKSFVYVAVVGIADELIQGILPNRYFGFGDIVMNITGGFAGIILKKYEPSSS